MAHVNYYLDLCVETFIVNDGAVLLRLHEKYHLWSAPGGHIDLGEDVNEAALREVWEEVGIKAILIGPTHWQKQDTESNLDLVPPLFMNRHRINATHEHSAFVFAATSDTRDINPQTEEDQGVECVWVTKEELIVMKESDARLREEVFKYASLALQLAATHQ